MKKIKYILLLLCLAFLFSCSKEEPVGSGKGTGTGTGDGEPVSVTFRVNVPGQKVVGARAVSETDERRLDEIAAFVFDEYGNYLYRAQATLETVDPQVSYREFNLKLFPSTSGRTIHFVANCASEIDALNSAGNLRVGDSEEALLGQIETAIKTSTELDGQTVFPFPMWGRKEYPGGILSSGLDPSADKTVNLLRSIARIDVGVGGSGTPSAWSWGGLANFEIRSVRVYRAADKGRVFPLQGNIGSGNLVTAPSLPTSAVSYVDYSDQSAATIASGNAIERGLYVYERPAGGDGTNGSADDCLCLVIGGSYDGGAETFYKINLYDGNRALLPILRNHQYRVNIKKVTGKGHADAATAVANSAMGIMADIEVLDAGMQNSVYDEQHHISADRLQVDFYFDGGNETLKIETNHPGGYTITIPDELKSWLTVTPETTSTSGTTTATLTAEDFTPDNDGVREGIIVIKAGRLELEVAVRQSSLPRLELDADPGALIFYMNGNPQLGTPKFAATDPSLAGQGKITVTTGSDYPLKEELTFTVSGGWTALNEFAASPNDGVPVSGNLTGGASGEYGILPTDITSAPANKEGVLRVTLSLEYRQGKTHTVSREINIRQIAQNSILLVKPWDSYPAMGSVLYAAANGGSKLTFNVISEDALIAFSTTSDLEGMVLDIQPVTDAHSEIWNPWIALAENNTFEPRTATVEVATATNRTLVNIEQEGYKLVFNVPKTTYVVKGAAPGNVQIPFTVNTEWKYALDGNDFADAGTIAAPYDDVEMEYEPTNVAPNAPKTVTDFIYEPQAYPAAAGTPAAQVFARQLTITNVDDKVGGNDRNVTIQRYVPSHFKYPADGYTASTGYVVRRASDNSPLTALQRVATRVEVMAQTNASWYGTYKDLTASSVVSGNAPTTPAAPWGISSNTVTVPANNTWNTRTMRIGTAYYNIETSAWATNATFDLSQIGYDLSGVNGNVPASISADGDNTRHIVTSTVNGCPSFRVRVRVRKNGTNNAYQDAWVSSTGGAGNRTIVIPANSYDYDLDVRIEIERTGKDWLHVLTVKQGSYKSFNHWGTRYIDQGKEYSGTYNQYQTNPGCPTGWETTDTGFIISMYNAGVIPKDGKRYFRGISYDENALPMPYTIYWSGGYQRSNIENSGAIAFWRCVRPANP